MRWRGKIAQSPQVEKVFVAPGKRRHAAGSWRRERRPIDVMDFAGLAEFAVNRKV